MSGSSEVIVDPNEDPLYHFTRLILRFLQITFSERARGSFQWVGSEENGEDDKLTQVSIHDESPVAATRVQARPQIVTTHSEVGFANLTLDGMKDTNIRTGEKTTMDLIPGAMLIHCISKNRIEARRIGWLVMTTIKRYRRVLARGFGFNSFGRGLAGEGMRLMPPTPPGALVSPEPTPEMRACTVIIPFTFRYIETEVPLDAPKAREISLKLHQGITVKVVSE